MTDQRPHSSPPDPLPPLPERPSPDAWSQPRPPGEDDWRPHRASGKANGPAARPVQPLLHRLSRLGTVLGFLGWISYLGYFLSEIVFQRGTYGPLVPALLVLACEAVIVILALFYLSRPYRLIGIGTAGFVSVLGGFFSLTQLNTRYFWGPVDWWDTFGPILLACLTLPCILAAIAWMRSEVDAIWREATEALPPPADSWDENAQQEQAKRVPYVAKGMAGWRVLAILPMLFTAMLTLFGLVMGLAFGNRLNGSELFQLIAAILTVTAYLYGLYSQRWVPRLLSIGGSAGVALLYIFVCAISALQSLSNPYGGGVDPCSVVISLFIAIVAACCLWGAVRYTRSELLRLEEKVREAAQPKEEDLLEGGNWDEKKAARQ